MKAKKTEISLKEILVNNVYMFKMICANASGLFWGQILLSCFSSIFAFLTYSYMLRYAINGISDGKSFEEIFWFVFACVFAHVIYSIVSIVCYDCIFPIMRTKFSYKIRKAIYEKAINIDLECYDTPRFYNDFSKVISECQSQANNLMSSVVDFVNVAVSFSANLILVWTIDPILIIFSFISITCVFTTSKINKLDYEKKNRLVEEKRKQDYSQRTFYQSEYAKEMRLTNMPILMLKRFDESGRRILKITKEYGISIAMLSYLKTECIEVISILGATIYACIKTFAIKSMGYGDCIIVVSSIGIIIETLINSADLFANFQKSSLYGRDIYNFLNYTPKIVGGNRKIPQDGALELKDVSFRYDEKSDYVLKNITMRIEKKQKIAIVGHNGAGKTTLIKLILRLYEAEGSIEFGGVNIKEYPTDKYRDIFSVVMQDHHVFSLSIAENILKDEVENNSKEVIEDALVKVGMLGKVKNFSEGINTVLTKEFDKDGEMLSGGEQQKIAIAHIYTKKTSFVILDEPSSALDPISEYNLYQEIEKACCNCGVIFVSHRLSSTVNADHIYLLENGQIIEHGTHDELMNLDGRYASMFVHQSENYKE